MRLEEPLDDVDRANDAGAETSWSSDDDAFCHALSFARAAAARSSAVSARLEARAARTVATGEVTNDLATRPQATSPSGVAA